MLVVIRIERSFPRRGRRAKSVAVARMRSAISRACSGGLGPLGQRAPTKSQVDPKESAACRLRQLRPKSSRRAAEASCTASTRLQTRECARARRRGRGRDHWWTDAGLSNPALRDEVRAGFEPLGGPFDAAPVASRASRIRECGLRADLVQEWAWSSLKRPINALADRAGLGYKEKEVDFCFQLRLHLDSPDPP